MGAYLHMTIINHPAGDVLFILVEPGKVVPYISVAEHWSLLSGAKIDEKMQKKSSLISQSISSMLELLSQNLSL